MSNDLSREYHFLRIEGRNYASGPFGTGKRFRYFNKVFDGKEGEHFATISNEIVLRTTPRTRREIKATVLEDDRGIQTLTIQEFSAKTGPFERKYFSFIGAEVKALLDFIQTIKTEPLGRSKKTYISDSELKDIDISPRQAQSILEQHGDLILALARSKDLKRDVMAVGYRRKQIELFESMLVDPKTSEGAWQKFLEKNTWIFGYGLSYQFSTGLDDGGKLERAVTGPDMTGPGKRVDALMKTRGRISSLCYVEIKKHNEKLLKNEYRSGTWAPNVELVSGVAQIQNTVHRAVEHFRHRYRSDETGEDLFNVEPRSCLVIGNLGEFKTPTGLNSDMVRSFELYRRNTWRPEIITFDELLERARFIVDHGEVTPEAREPEEPSQSEEFDSPPDYTGIPDASDYDGPDVDSEWA